MARRVHPNTPQARPVGLHRVRMRKSPDNIGRYIGHIDNFGAGADMPSTGELAGAAQRRLEQLSPDNLPSTG